jgi:mycofactocin precursor
MTIDKGGKYPAGGADGSPAGTPSRSGGVTDGPDTGDDPGISEDLLVEEVSIDGMCGVY